MLWYVCVPDKPTVELNLSSTWETFRNRMKYSRELRRYIINFAQLARDEQKLWESE
jgi:hypothetical protein